MDKRYLVDTNFLVQAERYYPQDIFPSFWERLRENIEDETIALHVTVLEEVYKNEDDLADWMKSVPKFTPVEISEKAFNKYLELCAWARIRGKAIHKPQLRRSRTTTMPTPGSARNALFPVSCW